VREKHGDSHSVVCMAGCLSPASRLMARCSSPITVRSLANTTRARLLLVLNCRCCGWYSVRVRVLGGFAGMGFRDVAFSRAPFSYDDPEDESGMDPEPFLHGFPTVLLSLTQLTCVW
jgi:hypothetical protein